MALSRRTVLILGVGTGVATVAGLQQVLDDSEDNATEPSPSAEPSPRVEVTEAGRPVPADAIWLHPNGVDTNPGSRAKPRRTPVVGESVAFHPGSYPGFTWFAPNGSHQSWFAPPGKTVFLDGQGTTKRMLTAGGVVNLYGDIHITSYAPAPSRDNTCVAVYYGGTAAGSEIDGPTIEKSSQAALGFQVPMKLSRLLVTDTGYSGILGTAADGTVFGDVQVLRVNRGNHVHDGQLGAVKMIRSKNVKLGPKVLTEDHNGANGLWCDVSCRTPQFVGSRVRTGASRPAKVGLLFEQTQGGIVHGVEVEGECAARIAATGGLRVWDNRFIGTNIALHLWQDRLAHLGNDPNNLPGGATIADVPWWTVGNEINNNTLTATGGYRIALAAYADGPALGMLLGADMFTALKGNAFTGSVQLGTATDQRETVTPAQLAAALGSKYAAGRVPVPPEIAALRAG